MKKIFVLALAFAAVPALACPRNQENLICTGDRVVTPGNYTGTVLAINPFKKTAVVDYDDFNSNGSFDVRELALGLGCLYRVCVGDRVVTSGNYTGRVIAVNPYKDSVVVDYDDFNSHGAFAVNTVKTQFGCLLGVCVGDSVVTPGNYTGKVLGVNRWDGTVAVDYDDFNSHGAFKIEDLSVTNYCTDYGDNDRQRPRGQWRGGQWGYSQDRN